MIEQAFTLYTELFEVTTPKAHFINDRCFGEDSVQPDPASGFALQPHHLNDECHRFHRSLPRGEFLTNVYALVADVHSWAGYQLAHFTLRLAAQ